MHLGSLVFGVNHLVLLRVHISILYFSTFYLGRFGLAFAEKVQFWAWKGMGVSYLFHLTITNITVVPVQTRICFLTVMAYLRSNLNLYFIYLRVNFVQITLRSKVVVHLTVSIVVF